MATLYDPKKSPIANLKVLLRALGDTNTRGSLDETASRLALLTSNRAVAGSSSEIKAAAFTAEVGGRYAVNTTSAAVTVTLPATPAAGDTVTLSDAASTFDTNNLTVTSTDKIDSSDSDLVSSAENAQIELVYINSTIGWKTFYTAAATGSTAITGTLSTTGNGSIGGTLGVTGSTTLAAVSSTAGTIRQAVTNYTADGAIALTSGVHTIAKTSAAAMTVAAPSSVNGTRMTIISNTDFAHVITFTGATLLDGTTGANLTVTMTALKGSAITVIAVGTIWLLESSSNVTSITV